MIKKLIRLGAPGLCGSVWLLTALALAGDPGPLPAAWDDKYYKERAEFWVRKLALGTDPDDYEYCRNNLVALGPPALPMVIKLLEADKSQSPWIHWNASLAFGKIGDERALPYLLRRIEQVSKEDLKARPEWTYARAFCALALGKVKDPNKAAVSPLRKVAFDAEESTFMRRAALLALGTLRDEASVAGLGTLLRDPQAQTTLRAAAALALGTISSEASAQALHEYLMSELKDHDPLADRMVVLAMGLQRREDSAELLRVLLASRDEDLRGTAALILAWLNDRPSAQLVRHVMDDPTAPMFTRCNAALALGNLGQRSEAQSFLQAVLATVLTNPKLYSSGTFAYCAIALGEYPDRNNLKLLYEVIRKSGIDPVVRLNGVVALGHLRNPDMVRPLIDWLLSFRGTNHDYLRGEIVRALMSHEPQAAIKSCLLKALEDPSVYVRTKVVVALARYPGRDTDQALRGVFDEKDYQLRAEAAVSLGVLKSQSAIPDLRRRLQEDESELVRLCARKALENVIKYANQPTFQTAGLQELIDRRLRVVGASLKDELDRLYTVAYQQVLELDKAYVPNTKVR